MNNYAFHANDMMRNKEQLVKQNKKGVKEDGLIRFNKPGKQLIIDYFVKITRCLAKLRLVSKSND